MRKILLLLIALIFVGCCDEKPGKLRRSSVTFYPVKVCAIGSATESGCWTYQADSYTLNETVLTIKTIDNHTYIFNTNGWAILITKK